MIGIINSDANTVQAQNGKYWWYFLHLYCFANITFITYFFFQLLHLILHHAIPTKFERLPDWTLLLPYSHYALLHFWCWFCIVDIAHELSLCLMSDIWHWLCVICLTKTIRYFQILTYCLLFTITNDVI